MAVSPVINGIKVIDADTHVIEPADLWTSRLSMKKWGSRVPHVRWDDELQDEAWYFGDERLSATASGAMAGWHEYPPKHPQRLADVDPALCSAPERLKRMDEYGVWAQVLYPNVAGFGMGKFLGLKDSELHAALHPGLQRLADRMGERRPEPPAADDRVAVLGPRGGLPEIERTAANGHRGVIFARQPDFFGLPDARRPALGPDLGHRAGASGSRSTSTSPRVTCR